MKVASQNLFAIPIYATEFDGFSQHAPALIARIKTLREKNEGIVASNRHAFHSQRDFHLHEDASTIWLRDSFMAFVNVALEPLMRDAPPWRPEISAAWAIASDKGGFLVPHQHFPSPWAGVVYLDAMHAMETDGPLEVGGAIDFLCPVSVPEAFGLQPNVIVHPKDGRALLFYGALQHMVHPHRSEKTRYSVSFNIALKLRTH